MSSDLSINEKIILVNDADEEVGTMEKLEAHQKGLLHRAFSIFIFNKKGEWLLQQRALSKYHSMGLWSNACCSHPRPNEKPLQAAHRRLMEEIGFDCDLKYLFKFQYFAPNVGPNITESEIDHIFFGKYDGEVVANPEEVMDWKWVSLETLESELKNNSNKYTFWLKSVFGRVKQELV